MLLLKLKGLSYPASPNGFVDLVFPPLSGVQAVPMSYFLKWLKTCSLCKQTVVALVTGNTATQAVRSLGNLFYWSRSILSLFWLGLISAATFDPSYTKI